MSAPGSGGGEGRRALKQRVRTAKGRKSSSTRWIARQLNDPYVHRARADGYRSRAAYKLIEIDDRFGLLARARRVIDLGAAPGGWSQVTVQRYAGAGGIVALDLQPVDPIPGVIILEKDLADADTPALIGAALGGQLADGVLSDIAPPTTGHRSTDHLRILGLCELAYDTAAPLLAPGGFFLAKVFQGGTEGELLKALRRRFTAVRHIKPAASRAESSEQYVLATGFRGFRPEPADDEDET